jgi:formylglycine-generating enzyme required for sulfatase activity
MVYVPPGPFLMGALDRENRAPHFEKPQHSVYLDGYWIDRTPVTNAMFTRFVEQTGYQTQAEKDGSAATWRSPQGPGSDLSSKMDHPVVQVTWNDAQAYCQWVGRRLPSEAEWEKAARGTDGRLYPWGDGAPDGSLCNFGEDLGDTSPVGRYSPQGDSPYGCTDMAGNVWEWVADWYNEDYYRHSPLRNPKGMGGGACRVMRGGAWNTTAWAVRCSIRDSFHPDYRFIGNGFRCAR